MCCCLLLLWLCVVVLLCVLSETLLGRAGGPHLLWVWRCCGCGCGCCWVGLPWTTFRRTPPLDPPSAGPPTISLFFFLFPPPFHCFCVSLGVFSWNFGGVLKRRCPEMCTFGVLGLSCETPAAPPDPSGPHFSRFGPPTLLGPTLRGPTFSRFGPPTHWGSTLRGSLLGGAQKGGAPMGKTLKHQSRFGQSRFGQSRSTLQNTD